MLGGGVSQHHVRVMGDTAVGCPSSCWPGARGAVLRNRRPDVYRGIGATAVAPEDEAPVALPTLTRSY